MNKYGVCSCGGQVTPVWFEEEELLPNSNTKTGRVRTACSHLVCILCLKNIIIDGSFDKPWRES